MTIVTGSNTIIKENLLAQEVVRLLDKSFVIMPFANTMYEGQIKQKWDTVSIQTFPNIAWQSATTAWAAISATPLTITKDQLVVDQLATFRANITNLEEIQSNLALASKVAERMSYGQKDNLEKFVVKTAVEWAYNSNILGSLSVALTSSTVADAVESTRVALEEQNVPIESVGLFVAPKIAKLIRQSSYFDGFKEWLDVRRNGFIGRIAWMEVYVSNNIGYKCMLAMDKDAVHFAAQWTGFKQTEAVDGFNYNILWEMAFGAKVCTENAKRIGVYYYSN
jgi:hypothetical protein